MQTQQKDVFTTIRTEGAILPPDLLQRIVKGDRELDGLAPEDYHLAKGERLNEAINRSWNRLQGVWAAFKAALEKLPPDDPATTVTRERWLLVLFQELGYGRLLTAKAIEIEGKSYPISHCWQHTPIHLVGCRVDLDRRTAGIAGAARTSPHSLVQEFLNRSDDHLWAFLSNGYTLRILRDNASLTRQAYVEFDLAGMMEGEVYADFILLWMLCHQSRVEAARPEQCWLEKWFRAAGEQGTRVLDQLRNGVEESITAFGRGFLTHPANLELREKLRSGKLKTQDYYRQLLRIVYRLLFLFVAEDRGLLLDPKAPSTSRDRYNLYYSTRRLRRLAQRRRGTEHADLFKGLRLVMEKLGSDEGCPELGLPALGSFLWSAQALPDLAGCEITNRDLLDAVRALAFTTDGYARRPVDFKNLDSDELGSVYESLLELHPVLDTDAGTFTLTTAGGSERKTTGSYYTPTSLINCLLDSALDPVLDEAVKKPNPEQAILNLKICDPACGSGHFLIAAAHRVAKRLAAVRTGDDEPAPEARRTALRDVIGRCIYGVDVNEMAVELCKVSLWMEALEPGKPLSFLDHRIKCGNSLLGATPALLKNGIPDDAFKPIEGDDKAFCRDYKRINKEERKNRQDRLFDDAGEVWPQLGELTTCLTGIDAIADGSIDGIRCKQERYRECINSDSYRHTRLLADAWCAAFVWKKVKTKELPYPITEDVFRKIEKYPGGTPDWLRQEIQRLAEQYQFFHWHLEFPDVFRVPDDGEKPENEQAGWSGGFDVVLGNPPWEKMQTEELQFFALRDPEIARLKGVKRKSAISALKETDTILAEAWQKQRRTDSATIAFIRNSGIFPLTGIGKFNTFALFAELNSRIVSLKGYVGCVVPSGIATDDTTKHFFKHLMYSKTLVSLYDFENKAPIFPGVHRSYKFCLLTLTGFANSAKSGAEFIFFAQKIDQIYEKERSFKLTASDLELVNPNTLTCPIFRFQKDAEITKLIYRQIPIFMNENFSSLNYYSPKIWRLINTTDDSSRFITKKEETNCKTLIPVIEAKTIHQFDHRFATFITNSKGSVEISEITGAQKVDSKFEVSARYYITEQYFCERMPKELGQKQWFLTVRNITNVTNERTIISTIIPRAAGCEVTPYIEIKGDAQLSAFLLGVFNSFALDFVARQKVGGMHLSYFIIYQLPVIPPNMINRLPLKLNFYVDRVLELVFTSWSIKGFAKDCDYYGPPFRWDEERRFLIRCELDAAYFHLYGIERDDVDYIMETFPIVKRKDEAKYGTYRTKEVILDIYDQMKKAMYTGKPYQTVLDPPPGPPAEWPPKPGHPWPSHIHPPRDEK
ncbi:Eco57I restriction-modification methylase domain-containing protein [Desulfotruncus alcoholivorax]|uniref:Eco57I restriction-modification methylase domain-containing protein n=1 Tax=Desulfotruncus alcoholivorax TaxID=265477 RepID=UPI0003FCA734|nr:N-6 DNA methylase [Desulfotruncus alcoholivorax]